MNMRPLLLPLITISVLASIIGCGGDAKNPTTTKPDEVKPDAPPVTGKLEIKDIKVGEGPGAKKGDFLYLTYTGKLLDGKQFDSNDKADADPYVVQLQTGGVIVGWDEGLVGIKKGGVRKLIVPPDKGYGAEGSGTIPPNSTLQFEIKCLDIVQLGDEARAYEKRDIKVGTGRAVKMGDTITVHYVGTLINGKQFDSSYDRKKPVEFELGTSAAPGFDAAIQGMKVGGKRWMRIPPAIGYGEMGKPPAIPANSLLIFEVELLKVR